MDLEPRIEKLQEKIETLQEQRLGHIEKTLEEVVTRQRDIERQLERYSARWGFVLMVGSALVAALKFFWQDFLKFIGK